MRGGPRGPKIEGKNCVRCGTRHRAEKKVIVDQNYNEKKMVSPPEPIAMYCGVGLSILLASDHHGAQVAGSSALHSVR